MLKVFYSQMFGFTSVELPAFFFTCSLPVCGRDIPKVFRLAISIYGGQKEQIHRVSISTAQIISTAEAAAL